MRICDSYELEAACSIFEALLVVIAVEVKGSIPITVVIATLNEEEGIGPTIKELKRTLEETTYLVVDGNSVERTVEIAKGMGAKVVFQEGSGKGQAIAQVKHTQSLKFAQQL